MEKLGLTGIPPMSLVGRRIQITWEFGEVGGDFTIGAFITSLKVADLTSELMLDTSSPAVPLVTWDDGAEQFRAKLRDPLKPLYPDDEEDDDLVTVQIGEHVWPPM